MLLLGDRALGAGEQCIVTPKQTQGPFYPGEKQFTADFDLTRLPGRAERAKGQIVYVLGRVLDADCNPVENANVEIWQACATGSYNHDRDPNPAPRDPNFRYWSEAFTDAKGEYAFKTIIPGAYPADTDWMRPAHIHFRVAKRGYKELITQMYFEGDQYNDKDLILNQIPASQRGSVIVRFSPSAPSFEPGTLTGVFDISLEKIGR